VRYGVLGVYFDRYPFPVVYYEIPFSQVAGGDGKLKMTSRTLTVYSRPARYFNGHFADIAFQGVDSCKNKK